MTWDPSPGQFYGGEGCLEMQVQGLILPDPSTLTGTGERLLARLSLSPAPPEKKAWGHREAVCLPATRSTGGGTPPGAAGTLG